MGLANVGSEINTKNSQDGVPHKQPDMPCPSLSQSIKPSKSTGSERINTSQLWWDFEVGVVGQIHVPLLISEWREMAPNYP